MEWDYPALHISIWMTCMKYCRSICDEQFQRATRCLVLCMKTFILVLLMWFFLVFQLIWRKELFNYICSNDSGYNPYLRREINV